MKITYDPSIPETFLPIVESRFEYAKEVFPSWCKSVYITYTDDNPDGAAAGIIPNYPYRMMTIFIYPPFFYYEKDEWLQVIFHELIHAVVSPLRNDFSHVISTFVKDDETLAYIEKKSRDTEEAVAQDASYMLESVLKLLDKKLES